jgi:hypothetical protein
MVFLRTMRIEPKSAADGLHRRVRASMRFVDKMRRLNAVIDAMSAPSEEQRAMAATARSRGYLSLDERTFDLTDPKVNVWWFASADFQGIPAIYATHAYEYDSENGSYMDIIIDMRPTGVQLTQEAGQALRALFQANRPEGEYSQNDLIGPMYASAVVQADRAEHVARQAVEIIEGYIYEPSAESHVDEPSAESHVDEPSADGGERMVNLFDWLEEHGVDVPEEHRAEVAEEFAEIARRQGYEPPAGSST